MKSKVLTLILLIILSSNISFSQSGQNCFNTQFNNDANSLDIKNGYLLGYLCTMMYADNGLRYLLSDPPPGKDSRQVKVLKFHDEVFERAYRDNLSFLFKPSLLTNPLGNGKNPSLIIASAEPGVRFDFHHKCNPNGYDPEAMLITTPNTIYVVFRGTDRVSCSATSNGYEWAEWLTSDFYFLKRPASLMHNSIKGNVHSGMVESLMEQDFAKELGDSINKVLINRSTNVKKKVWITGHSLGGGHAQLFALYLKYNYNINAQGLYLYESPHPGDRVFATQLNTDIGKSRIQRFEFGDDPICTLPPQAFFFARSGERNYYKDYNSPALRSEQILADDAKVLCALGNLPAEQIPGLAHFVFPPYCPGSTCFHHPTLILKAIRHELSASQLATLPGDVPTPVTGEDCTTGDLTKAANNNVVSNTITALGTLFWGAATNIANLAGNLIGGEEGSYKLICYRFKDCSKKYLAWDGEVGHQLTLNSTGTVFSLVHKGTGGYQLAKGNANMAANVTFNLLGFPTGQEVDNNIFMKARYEKDLLGNNSETIGDEETWYILPVPNKANTYVFYNWNTKKVLDAADAICDNDCKCIAGNSNLINEFSAKDNDASQVWILQKQ